MLVRFDTNDEETQKLWREITCPTLLCYGEDSWASNPAEEGRLKYFKNAIVKDYESAGYWLHHDQFDKFLADLREFFL